jgi:hypothetical protein
MQLPVNQDDVIEEVAKSDADRNIEELIVMFHKAVVVPEPAGVALVVLSRVSFA